MNTSSELAKDLGVYSPSVFVKYKKRLISNKCYERLMFKQVMYVQRLFI